MVSSGIKEIVMIVLSFLMGAILQILPLPHWAAWARPEWVFVILVFWMILRPQHIGIFVAFCIGIFMDLLMGTLLGLYALVFTGAVYLLSRLQPRFTYFPLWKQLLIIFAIVLLQLILQSWVLEIIDEFPKNWSYWMPAFTSTLIWPWFYILLKDKREAIGSF